MVALLLLVCGWGGKWETADHLSKILLFFSVLLILQRRSLWRLLRHPACPGVCGFGIWYGVCGLLSPSPVAAWSSLSGVIGVLSLAVLGLSTWGEFHRRFVECLFASVACAQVALLVLGTRFGIDPILIFPGNPQYVSFWSCTVVFLALGRAFPKGDSLRSMPEKTGTSKFQEMSKERLSASFFSKPYIPQVFHRSTRGKFLPRALRGCSAPTSVSSRIVRWVWGGVIAVAATGVFLLPVRSGVLALCVGALVFGYTRFGRRGLMGTGFALILCFAALPKSYALFRLKIDDPRAFKRIDIWQSSLAGLRERPLFGWGPGQYENMYWQQGIPQESEPVRFEMTTDRAHNEFLQLFVESGLPGGLFALLALAGWWMSNPQGIRGPGVWAAGAGAGAFALVNSPFVLPVCVALVGCLVALAPPGRWMKRPLLSSLHRQWAIPVVGVFVCLFGLGEVALAANEMLGHRRSVFLDSTNLRLVETRRGWAEQKLHSEVNENSLSAERELRELLRWNPGRAELWRDLGHLEADHRPPSHLDAALKYYHEALTLYPKAPWFVEKAQVLARAGNPRAARRALSEAIRIEPRYFDAWLGYGLLLRREGRSGDARKWLVNLRRQSDLWPTVSPGDSGYRRTVLHREMAVLDRVLHELSL